MALVELSARSRRTARLETVVPKRVDRAGAITLVLEFDIADLDRAAAGLHCTVTNEKGALLWEFFWDGGPIVGDALEPVKDRSRLAFGCASALLAAAQEVRVAWEWKGSPTARLLYDDGRDAAVRG